MVVKNRKKNRRMRGSMTHGWGSKKKHRGSGSRGGVGMAGLKKHKKSWVIKNCPNYFGKRGFKVPVNAKKQIRSMNLRDVDILAVRMNKTEINLTELGIDKVLSSGQLTRALTIKAKKIVEKAKQKIEQAGGKAIEHV